jgi:hypothetical protein
MKRNIIRISLNPLNKKMIISPNKVQKNYKSLTTTTFKTPLQSKFFIEKDELIEMMAYFENMLRDNNKEINKNLKQLLNKNMKMEIESCGEENKKLIDQKRELVDNDNVIFFVFFVVIGILLFVISRVNLSKL